MRKLPLEAFSKFGTARLSELNLYYIFAAQIARFITLESGLAGSGTVFPGFLEFEKKFIFAWDAVFDTSGMVSVYILHVGCTRFCRIRVSIVSIGESGKYAAKAIEGGCK